MRALDLFCCAGGSSMGLHRAGFEVYGNDITLQPNYPFAIHYGDAIKVLKQLIAGMKLNFSDGSSFGLDDFDHITASPPCQGYSDMINLNKNHDDHVLLIEPVRELLKATGKPYIIENVDSAPLLDPVLLCGTMFPELRVIRHRLFESNLKLTAPAHISRQAHPLLFTHDKRKPHYGKIDQNTGYVQVTGGGNCTAKNAREAMGISWMLKREINEALPPVYMEYLGRQVMEQL